MTSKQAGLLPVAVAPISPTKTQQMERYRLLVESVQDYAIFMLDPTGHVASWNAGAKRFKGYDESEIIGQHFSVFYTPEDLASCKPARELVEATRDGRTEDEGWRVRKDGSQFWANVVITALYDENGGLQGFAKVTRDLTARKAMEDELAHTNEALQRREKALTMLNEAKDEFISLASHQLRTPATGVKQYLNLVLEGFMGDVPDPIRSALNKANDSNERQLELVNDLLQVAQLDAGKIIPHKADTDIVRLVSDVIAEQYDVLKERKQQVLVDVPGEPVMAYIDGNRLRMVFENLVENASKYTRPGGRIEVSVTSSAADCSVTVKDTGVGIKQTDIPKLFAKFSRIKNELSDRVGGSGLGLYWANRVVELHSGHIHVQSQFGKGSEFTVTVPLEES